MYLLNKVAMKPAEQFFFAKGMLSKSQLSASIPIGITDCESAETEDFGRQSKRLRAQLEKCLSGPRF